MRAFALLILSREGAGKPADKCKRQLPIVGERQIPLWPAKLRYLGDELSICMDWWIDSDVLLESRKVEECLLLLERRHVVADALDCARDAGLDLLLDRFQPRTYFRGDGCEVLFVCLVWHRLTEREGFVEYWNCLAMPPNVRANRPAVAGPVVERGVRRQRDP
jgi:hypothetical protein